MVSGEMLGFISFSPTYRAFGDKLVESFAGAHDSLNDFIGWYDKAGNTIEKGNFLQEVGNVINVGIALPFAAATFKQEFGMGPLQVNNDVISDSFK